MIAHDVFRDRQHRREQIDRRWLVFELSVVVTSLLAGAALAAVITWLRFNSLPIIISAYVMLGVVLIGGVFLAGERRAGLAQKYSLDCLSCSAIFSLLQAHAVELGGRCPKCDSKIVDVPTATSTSSAVPVVEWHERAKLMKQKQSRQGLLLAAGILLSMAVPMTVFSINEGYGGWVFLAWFALFVFALWRFDAKDRTIRRSIGLCCPECSLVFDDRQTKLVAMSRHCPTCRALILTSDHCSWSGAGPSSAPC